MRIIIIMRCWRWGTSHLKGKDGPRGGKYTLCRRKFSSLGSGKEIVEQELRTESIGRYITCYNCLMVMSDNG